MQWLLNEMKSAELRIPSAFPSIDQLIRDGGGLDRSLLLSRAQCREYEDQYELHRANTALRDSFPNQYQTYLIALEDAVKDCGAYLHALECRRRIPVTPP
jgi:hypothetical protein